MPLTALKDNKPQQTLKATVIPAVAIVLVLGLFGALIGGFSFKLRKETRSQIIQRDAEILYPVIMAQLSQAEEQSIASALLFEEADLIDVALNASKLKGVIAVRIFDAAGDLSAAVPFSFFLGDIPPEDWSLLRKLEPVSRFHENIALSEFIFDPEQIASHEPVPLLEVLLPIYDETTRDLIGVTHYLIEGYSIMTEFRRLDRNLLTQAIVIFLGGAVILVAVLAVSFRQLARANRLLEERTRKLLEANYELNQRARTSAIGALTAHLFHGLKNPLAGLQQFVSNLEIQPGEGAEEDWQSAMESTQRMQAMIQEIAEIISDEEAAASYTLTVSEICELVRNKVSNLARSQKVTVRFGDDPDSEVDGRTGNLLIMVLVNLAQNAIEASPEGATVHVDCSTRDGCLVFSVRDEGPGIPGYMEADPFRPRRSAKPGGSGIGLAISNHLAQQVGGALRLAQNSDKGACFEVSLPERG